MSNSHRITWIDTQIRSNHYPNAVQIAEKFEISSRQALRDLEYLRDTMCAPLIYSHQYRGYYYEGQTFAVANLVMTEDQRKTLVYLAEQYKRMENEHATHLARLFTRLVGGDVDEEAAISIPIFPVDSAVLSRFDVLSHAIKEHRKVQITYKNHFSSLDTLFSPYKIYVYRKENYVVGYSETVKEIRLFRMSELTKAVLMEQNYDLAPLLGRTELVPYWTGEMNTAVVCFNISPEGRMLGMQAVAVAPGTYQINYSDKEQLIAKLLSCHSGFTIISPKWLSNLVENRIRRLTRKDAVHGKSSY